MAEILNGKINLAKLNNAVIKEMNGRKGPVKCIIIPIEENNIYCGNNGSAYLSFTCAERPMKSDWGETHTIRPQVASEKYRSMSKEDRMAIPFIGGLSRVEFKNNYNNGNSRGTTDYTETDDLPASNPDPSADLPF